MKRFHVSLTVSDLARSVNFYTQLFDAPPTSHKTDYAKWMLEDPRINFSLSTHGNRPGIDHIGVQAEDEAEFMKVREQVMRADDNVFEQPDTTCCYANSTKTWARDPDGVAWEAFLTRSVASEYGDGSEERAAGNLAPRAPAWSAESVADVTNEQDSGCCSHLG